MVGGIIVQAFFVKTNKYHLLDAKTVERIRGVALDFLVVSAIASVSIPVVIHYFIPFSILLLAGTSYIVISTWFLAPKMLPQPWFERAIIEFGTQTGVTAMGLMLLRIVDPEFKTAALEPFALKQMVYEPFFGGGFITALTPLLILSMGLPTFLAIMLSISVIAIVLGILLGWFPNRASYQNKG
jgi:ESS family glutamate:Na+ symporter